MVVFDVAGLARHEQIMMPTWDINVTLFAGQTV